TNDLAPSNFLVRLGVMAVRAEPAARPRMGEVLTRSHPRLRIIPFLGPAFIACVAYIDPGNFATNIAAGSKFGFTLACVIVVGIIGLCYVGETVYAKPPFGTVAEHAVLPQLAGGDSLLLAVGIIGATVMPHVIYLHSALMQDRIVPENDAQAHRLFRYTRID